MAKILQSMKDFYEAVNKEKCDITIEDVCKSRRFNEFVTLGTKTLFGIYGVACPISFRFFHDPDDPMTGCTDNIECIINTGNPLFIRNRNGALAGVREGFFRILGVLFHEMGHIMFTDSEYRTKEVQNLCTKNEFLKPRNLPAELEDNYRAIKEAIENNDGFKEVIIKLLLTLSNIIEDGRIENLLLKSCSRCAGFCKGLTILRTFQFEDTNFDKDVRAARENDIEEFQLAFNPLLYYAKFGKDHATYRKGLLPMYEAAKPFVDDFMLKGKSNREMFDDVRAIIVLAWDYGLKEIFEMAEIMKALESMNEEGGSDEGGSESGDSSSSSSDGSGKKSSKSSSSKSTEASGTAGTESSDGSDSEDSSEDNAESAEGENDKEGSSAESESGKGGAEDGTEDDGNKDGSSKSDKSDKDSSSESDDSTTPAGDGYSDKEIVKSADSEKIKEGIKKTMEAIENAVQTPESGYEGKGLANNKEASDAPVAQDADIELNGIINEAAEDAVNSKNRAAITEDIYNHIRQHSSSRLTIHVLSPDEFKSDSEKTKTVEQIKSEIATPVVRAAREINNHILSDQPTGKKMTYSGGAFKVNQVYRRNYRYFEKKGHKLDTKKLAVAIRIDESGSMICSDRYEYAKLAACCLYQLSEKVETLDVAIFGDTAYGRGAFVSIPYCDFGVKPKDVMEDLSYIYPKNGNNDALAISLLGDKLLKQDADERILISISDGAPTECTGEELKNAVKKYLSKGVNVIAMAIGSDKERIASYYGEEHFCDIKDLNELPKTLIRLITQKM